MKEWQMIHDIKKRLKQGQSVSGVARDLCIARKTVRKYRDRDEAEIRTERKRAYTRTCKVDRFRDWLKKRVQEYETEQYGIVNSECIYRELAGMGYRGSVRTVRRYVSKLRTKKRGRVFEPFETLPGAQAMVDLSEYRQVETGGIKQNLYFLGMVLCFSRKKYGEWYDRPVSTEMFIEFHERAFRHFEGTVSKVVYDQTKLAVLQERYGECDFNSDFYAMVRYYGYEPYICKRYDPQTKGKVESVMRYVKHGFLPGRTFSDMEDLQSQWEEWLHEVGNSKVHETTGRPPEEAWQKEKKHLKRLPEGHYRAQASLEKRKVLLNGLVKVLGNRYSAPQAYQGKEILVRVTEEKVEMYTKARQHLYSHWRSRERGKTFKVREHYRREYTVPTAQLEAEVRGAYGDQGLLHALKKRFPRHYRDQLKGLIRLQRDTSAETLRRAAERALTFHCASLGNIERIIRGIEDDKVAIPPVAANQGNVLSSKGMHLRSMSYYAEAADRRKEAYHGG